MGLTACTLRRKTMYKSTDYEYEQLSFINFNMACGMQLDMNNEWIHIAQKLPWRAWETLYVAMFPSNTGNVAKPCRMVLGALIIQTRLGFSDRELVDQLRQNPYYKYFIGLASFQYTAPFTRTLLVEWRKRIDFQFAVNANNLLCDAAPKAFRFRKKQGAAYIDRFMQQGYAPAAKFCDQIITIHLLYDQQKYMYDNKTHSVENRIVSISQPYVRPVVFLFRIFITADLEKLNKKTNKQYEGYGSAVKTGYSFLKKKILYWFA